MRTWLCAIVTTTAVVLGACSSEPPQQHQSAAVTRPSPAAKPNPSSAAIARYIYIGTMRHEFPQYGSARLLRIGHEVCNILGDSSYLATLKDLIDVGLNGYQAGYAITTATATLCPQYRSKVPRLP